MYVDPDSCIMAAYGYAHLRFERINPVTKVILFSLKYFPSISSAVSSFQSNLNRKKQLQPKLAAIRCRFVCTTIVVNLQEVHCGSEILLIFNMAAL